MAAPTSGGSGSGGGVASMSGVIFSDDDSDLSVGDIDEGVIASELLFGLSGFPPTLSVCSHRP